MSKSSNEVSVHTYGGLGFMFWLGGAVWVMRQPGYNFWDGLIWLYYVGRFAAQHFTALNLN